MTVDIKYLPGDDVVIKAVDIRGKIDCVELNGNGLMYRVVYWASSERKTVWVYDWELKCI